MYVHGGLHMDGVVCACESGGCGKCSVYGAATHRTLPTSDSSYENCCIVVGWTAIDARG